MTFSVPASGNALYVDAVAHKRSADGMVERVTWNGTLTLAAGIRDSCRGLG